MIKECNEMYVNGELNKNFLKGRILYNTASKVEGCRFGKVVGFYMGKENNKTHKGKRLFVIEKIDNGERKNWWLDVAKGINPNLFLIEEDIIVMSKK
jgi:hypothetical protein